MKLENTIRWPCGKCKKDYNHLRYTCPYCGHVPELYKIVVDEDGFK